MVIFITSKKVLKKGVKDYISEFWCEVMAYRIGITLGFDILKYEPAILNGEMGCLCRTMIDSETEELVEGGKYFIKFLHLTGSLNAENAKLAT